MRIIETIHPNLQMRTFTTDRKITTIEISKYHNKFEPGTSPTPKTLKLYSDLRTTPCISAVGINDCNITMQIHEAFERNEEDWNVVRDTVLCCIANFFELEYSDVIKAHSIKDDRQKFEVPVVDFEALYAAISRIAIPHDFETHRMAWRNAIVIAKGDQEDFDKKNGEKLHDGPNLYWKNELEKFDLAFDALLALKLPQS